MVHLSFLLGPNLPILFTTHLAVPIPTPNLGPGCWALPSGNLSIKDSELGETGSRHVTQQEGTLALWLACSHLLAVAGAGR